MDKPSEQRIPITDPQHLIDIGITLGLITALQAVQDIDSAEKLTGVGISRYAIRAVEAEHRVQLMQRNIRLAVANNIDLDKNNICWNGRPYLIIEPKDLVELAESPPAERTVWLCHCGARNLLSRGTCFRCQSLKPDHPMPPP